VNHIRRIELYHLHAPTATRSDRNRARNPSNLALCIYLFEKGRLKMTHMKMTDHRNCRAWNSRIWKWRIWNWRTWNWSTFTVRQLGLLLLFSVVHSGEWISFEKNATYELDTFATDSSIVTFAQSRHISMWTSYIETVHCYTGDNTCMYNVACNFTSVIFNASFENSASNALHVVPSQLLVCRLVSQ